MSNMINEKKKQKKRRTQLDPNNRKQNKYNQFVAGHACKIVTSIRQSNIGKKQKKNSRKKVLVVQ